MQVRRSALVARPASHLFDLIEGAEHYPAFLPWCSGATILVRDDSVVSADISIRFKGVGFEIRTRNPKRRPEFMAIHLERGPFRRFYGEWQLKVLAEDACKVNFLLDYEFDSVVMTRMAGPVFDKIADKLVDAFVQRAVDVPPPVLAPTAPTQAPAEAPRAPDADWPPP
ncbi:MULTISPECIES: type II toxin-antitoxin system RatA family toxin [unclassified Rubrivivax]|uniref:type II toxin-antitoxin system RatA family toxin n=1 Tax=unclassified Rubrivivax TaxID=2649762 RepID=UPI001E42E00D|nr:MULTISPECIES: type II toxin-antitoxin system RatA family toxin [unclassified Rubrivivax]MCC9598146.1 type II toxin-antitoxin system RatA family toxin [Rubrivivax sp. JA1055]MCC9645597.1 type II toxin-antitoxin system RatA family toxin [Rubrivivax sp. JA1029]